MDNFILVYLEGTDGDVKVVGSLTKEEIKAKVKNLNLTPSDYAVVQGQVIKNFGTKGF